MKILSDYDALCCGLWLAVTAPSEEKAAEAVLACEIIATRLSEHEIKRAKKEIERRLEGGADEVIQ